MASSDFASTSQTVPKCVICDSVSDEKLTEVGLESLRDSCEVRCRDDIIAFLDSHAVVFVHASCRKSFTRSRDLKKIKFEPEETPVCLLRSSTGCFNWKSMCFLCGNFASNCTDSRHVCIFEISSNV